MNFKNFDLEKASPVKDSIAVPKAPLEKLKIGRQNWMSCISTEVRRVCLEKRSIP